MGLKLNGATSGSIEIDVPAVAGTDTAITIPATTGGEFIVSDSNGDVNIDSGTFFVDASTNQVGIRTTTPATATTQFGGAATGLAVAGAQPVVALEDTTATTYAYFGLQNNDVYIDNLSEGFIRFATDNTERMKITSQGLSMFSRNASYYGTVSSTQFHSFDTNYNQWTLGIRNTHGSAPFGVIVKYTGASPNNNLYPFFFAEDSGSTTRFQVFSNGGIANYSANNVNLSDEREKKNIEALDSTWGCLKNWDLKKFHYNEDADTDDKRYGVIAQQVAPHCPEVITDWVKQKAEDAVLDDDGNVVTPAKEEITRMAVKEQQMMWMAIKALQEAQTRIETLETTNASLEARLTALEGGAS
jgi:hypothetical protein